MEPTRILVDEHTVILRVLACLERLAGEAEEAGTFDRTAGVQIVDFLATFADRCHHGKEEQQLFPALIAKGMPSAAGPLAVMTAEHEEGRALVRRLRTAAAGEGHPADYARAARSFVALLRDHIAKENEVLFPMAEAMLTAEEKEGLLAAFERVEHDDLGPDTHGRYLDLARGLCERFGVDADGVPTVPGGGCCGGLG